MTGNKLLKSELLRKIGSGNEHEPTPCPDLSTGLSLEDVMDRIRRKEINIPTKDRSVTLFGIIRKNVCTYFNLIFLLITIFLCMVKAYRALTFLPVIIGNTLIGIVQEKRSAKALDQMKLMSIREVTVIREKKQMNVLPRQLVRDDIVLLGPGDQIPADAVVCEGELLVNESLLTGETDEIRKTSGEHLLSGSYVISGKCHARLERVGDESYVSEINREARTGNKGEQSEMIRSLDSLVKVIGILIIPASALLFYIHYMRQHLALADSVTSTVAAVLGMIPEGLYLLASVALAVSVMRLARSKVLVHNMKSIETLARADILCVDKTGTITENSMHVWKCVPLAPAGTSAGDTADKTEMPASDETAEEAETETITITTEETETAAVTAEKTETISALAAETETAATLAAETETAPALAAAIINEEEETQEMPAAVETISEVTDAAEAETVTATTAKTETRTVTAAATETETRTVTAAATETETRTVTNAAAETETRTVTNAAAESETALTLLLGDFAAAMGEDNITMKAIRETFRENTGRAAQKVMAFSPEYKYSMAAFDDTFYLLGAPEFLLLDDFEIYRNQIEKWTHSGYRAVLFGETAIEPDGALTSPVHPLGLVLFYNPVREHAEEIFHYFSSQGVSMRVISGDSAQTASEVARAAGIEGADRFVDVSMMSDDQLAEASGTYTVFGRVTPRQKRILIQAMKNAGHTVAMTGDGVNDVLALRAADCSIAMASGSDAAAHAAQMVLLDSDFSRMPSVVDEGRRVVNNIERTASLFLVKNIFSLLLAIFAIVFRFEYPLEPSQISLIGMFTIGIPAFFLSLEISTDRIRGHFMTNVLFKALPAGLTDFMLAAGMAVYGRVFGIARNELATSCTILLAIVGILILYRVASPMNTFHWVLWGSMIVGLLSCMVFLSELFIITPLGIKARMLLLLFVLLTVPVLTVLSAITEKIWKAAGLQAG